MQNQMKSKRFNFLFALVIFFCFLQLIPSQENQFGPNNWLWLQRVFPYDTMPQNAYYDAISRQQEETEVTGYYLSPSVQWTAIGPTIAGSGAGRVASVKYDPSNPNTIYIAAHGGGVWKSSNGGTNFSPIADILPTQSSGALCIDPNPPHAIYYATGGTVDNFLYNYYGLGVFKSTDGGTTWSGGYNSGLPKLTHCYRILVNPNQNHSNMVYLAERSGLYISTDYGVTWNLSNAGTGSCQAVVTSNDGSIVLAAGGYGNGIGYWRSSDFGSLNSFQHLTGSGFTPYERTSLAISSQLGNDNHVYGITAKYEQSGGTTYVRIYDYRSDNSGINFNSPVLVGTECNTGSGCGMESDFLFVEASPIDYSKAYIGFGNGHPGEGLYVTSNTGSNWNSVSAPGADQNCFAFNPSNSNEMLLGYDQGLRKSTDGGSNWLNIGNTLPITEIYRVTSDLRDPNRIMGAVTDMGFTRTTNGGTNWSTTNEYYDGTNVVYSQLDPQPNPDLRRAVGSKGACFCMHYTTNGGVSWYSSDMIGYRDGNEDWIALYKEDPFIKGVFFCPLRNDENSGKININLSTNYGANWNPNTNPGVNAPFHQILTGDFCESPQKMAICEADTNIIYISTVDFGTGNCPNRGSRLWKTVNAGNTWTDLHVNNFGIPNRYISSVTTDRKNTNVVYLTISGYGTFSGFGTGHVFRSSNGGANWVDISGANAQGDHYFVPDVPVNDLIIKYISPTQKQLFIATDIGVYVGYDPPLPEFIDGYHWNKVADGLPGCVILDIDYDKNSGLMRAATFGRSIYQINIGPESYVVGTEYLFSDANGLNVNSDIIVTEGSRLILPYASTFKMAVDKKIIIEDGGWFDVTSNDPVYFTSQSGSWGGIEIHDGAYGTIKNSVFSNTETPITIESQRSGGKPILVQNCTFNDGSVTISGRDSVTIYECTTNTPSASTGTAISAVYCDNLVLSKNTINDCWAAGIMVSNSSPVLLSNVINHSAETNTAAGISIDNCYSGTINYNEIYNYNYGIYMYYSSPTMLENVALNNTTSSSTPCALYTNYLSSPRLKPTSGGLGTIWDAGINDLKTNSQGNGIYMYDRSLPNIDYGFNKIYGFDYHLIGEINNGENNLYFAYDNCWEPDNPPVRENIIDATVYDDPYTCEPPGGGGLSMNDNDNPSVFIDKSGIEDPESENIEPPPPMIINYGNGIYDTIRVSSVQLPLSADQLLFSQGLDKEIAGYYQDAIHKYKLVIQNYQDSNAAITAMKKIMYCNDKMHAGLNAYTDLRTYYQNLAQQNQTDTGFVKAAKEMATKCFVRMNQCPDAITAYEIVVQNSSDSLEVLCSELNIIETYMIMEQEGDTHGFTGQLKQLKPKSILDGLKMLNEKLHRSNVNKPKPQIPEVFSLSQNYPNPFNPLTKINFAVPMKSMVTLKIYDILGRLVKTLVNEFKEAGYYTVQFDGSSLASGIYFYKIEAGDFVQSKKMVLVK